MRKIVLLLLALLAIPLLRAEDGGAGKTVKILTVGNSFSNNACRYLPEMFRAGKLDVLLDRSTTLGGCSLSRHLNHAEKWEADPGDPAGRPYTVRMPDGKTAKASLQEVLQKEKWDYITIQQVSTQSADPESYAPAASLLAIIRKYAPQAEVVMHETWSYRPDAPWLKKNGIKNNMTEREMYERLHAAYARAAGELGLRIIPAGTAFQAALHDPDWRWKIADADSGTLVYPDLPEEQHSLHKGYSWQKQQDGSMELRCDYSHASRYGEYLAGAVWYEFFFGGVAGNSFTPEGITPEEAAILRRIAADTVRKQAPERMNQRSEKGFPAKI